MPRTIVILNNSGRRAGSLGDLRNVYSLGSYDPDIDYRIEVETLVTEDGEDHDRGALDLPVRSVGKIGLQYYFATDLRFVNYPQADCVLPTTNELTLQEATGFRGAITGQLVFDDFLIFRSRERKERSDVLEELGGWARLQGDRWKLPADVVEAIAAIEKAERELSKGDDA